MKGYWQKLSESL
jgi:hypothetical protein